LEAPFGGGGKIRTPLATSLPLTDIAQSIALVEVHKEKELELAIMENTLNGTGYAGEINGGRSDILVG